MSQKKAVNSSRISNTSPGSDTKFRSAGWLLFLWPFFFSYLKIRKNDSHDFFFNELYLQQKNYNSKNWMIPPGSCWRLAWAEKQWLSANAQPHFHVASKAISIRHPHICHYRKRIFQCCEGVPCSPLRTCQSPGHIVTPLPVSSEKPHAALGFLLQVADILLFCFIQHVYQFWATFSFSSHVITVLKALLWISDHAFNKSFKSLSEEKLKNIDKGKLLLDPQGGSVFFCSSPISLVYQESWLKFLDLLLLLLLIFFPVFLTCSKWFGISSLFQKSQVTSTQKVEEVYAFKALTQGLPSPPVFLHHLLLLAMGKAGQNCLEYD